MADTRGMQDLFGLDIDRLAKGFGVQKYNFLQEVQVRKMKGDSVRWFQKTAGTLSATSPSKTSNVSAGARPTTLEVSWTRNTSYKKIFFVEGFLNDEDISDAEIDTFATTVRDLTMGIWTFIAVTYNSDDVANNPSIYLNKVARSMGSGLTESTTPTGTRDTDAASSLVVGNNAITGGTRGLDGATSIIWGFPRILSATELGNLYDRTRHLFV